MERPAAQHLAATTNNQELTASKEQLACESMQLATSNQRLAIEPPTRRTRQLVASVNQPPQVTKLTRSKQPASSQPAASSQQPAASSQKPATSDRQPATGNRQPPTLS
jgi:hypothetical protein